MGSISKLRELRSGDVAVRRLALEGLKSLDDAELLDEIVRWLVEDDDEEVRKEAEKVILETRPAAALNRLKGMLTSPTARARYTAARMVQALGWIPSTPLEHARLLVAQGLFELAAREGAVALDSLALEATTGSNHTASALSAMVAIGHAAVPRLLTIFRNSRWSEEIARAVAEGRNRASELFFTEGLKDHGKCAETLCRVLSDTPIPRTTRALTHIVQDRTNSSALRRVAAQALVATSEATAD